MEIRLENGQEKMRLIRDSRITWKAFKNVDGYFLHPDILVSRFVLGPKILHFLLSSQVRIICAGPGTIL